MRGYKLRKPPPFLDFREGALFVDFDLKPETALSFFKAKGIDPTWSYLDMVGEEHDVAFTVAKMLDTDLLADTKKAVDEAIESGTTLAEFRKQLEPKLHAAGWWGTDADGNRLGSAWRLETIFRTNIQQAYSVGHWEQIDAQKGEAPWLMYDAIDDHRTRPWHAELDNTIRRVDDPFWKTYYPPNGYNCRCSAIQLSDADLDAAGLTPNEPPDVPTKTVVDPVTNTNTEIPVATDAGFNRNPGRDRLDFLRRLAQAKAQAIDDEQLREAALAAASALDDSGGSESAGV